VAMQPHTGAVLGQWRLRDPRLSLRHLAAQGHQIGVALQAEHDDPLQRSAAPLLAVLDEQGLQLPATPEGLPTGGYGGDIAALNNGFVISATRADRVLVWSTAHGWYASSPLSAACALAVSPDGVWIGTERGALRCAGSPQAPTLYRIAARLDNHLAWVF
jgi:uncharacterized protein